MKSEELHIGDYVRVKQNAEDEYMFGQYEPGEIVQVQEILSDGINPDWYGAEVNEMLSVNMIEPIPLTPEILKENGWYESIFIGSYGSKCMRLDGPGLGLEEIPEDGEHILSVAQWCTDPDYQHHLLDLYMAKGSSHVWVNYVHELQQILRIHGMKEEFIVK